MSSAYNPSPISHAALHSLIENAHNFAVYRVKYDPAHPFGGELEFVSPSIRDIVGIDSSARFENWFENLHPDEKEHVMEANRQALKTGKPYNQTARVFHPGKRAWVLVHTISNPFFDSSGRLTHYDGVVIDLSEQINLQETQRLRRAAEGLRDILSKINTNRPLPDTLAFIAKQANELLEADSTMIRHVTGGGEKVETVASYQLPPEFDDIRVTPFYRGKSDQSLLTHQPVAVSDVRRDYMLRLHGTEISDELQRAGLEATVKHYRSMLKAPLFTKGEIYGAITFHYIQQRLFNQEDLHLAMSIADQAALAIENAFLIERVKVSAVLEERNRLARELHDAVTQTLFSAALTAEVLPLIWERDPGEGRRKLEDLRDLTRAALAEMRTLLVELRPAAMADTGMESLLRHLANAFTARAHVPVQFEFSGTFDLPLAVKEAFYRISQEALNNITKHADAGQVWVSLIADGQTVTLQVKDDGAGFEPAGAGDHKQLGLQIMQERAGEAGAQLEITSQPGCGTCVQVLWRSGTTD